MPRVLRVALLPRVPSVPEKDTPSMSKTPPGPARIPHPAGNLDDLGREGVQSAMGKFPEPPFKEND